MITQLPAAPRLRGLGVCTHFARRDKGWKIEHLLPLMQQMGVSLVRMEILWDTVELQRGVYAIPQVDRQWLDAVRAAGIDVLLLLCYGNPIYDNPLDPQAFAAYAAWMVRELRDYPLVAAEIWNEPTNFRVMRQYGGNWSARPPCAWADKFCQLQQLSSAAIRQVNPNLPIISNPGDPQFFHMLQSHPEAFQDIDGVGTPSLLQPLPARNRPPMAAPRSTSATACPSAMTTIASSRCSAARSNSPRSTWAALFRCTPPNTAIPPTTSTASRAWSPATPRRPRPCTWCAASSSASPAGHARCASTTSWMTAPIASSKKTTSDSCGTRPPATPPKASFHALRRLAQWLGTQWSWVATPPAALEAEIKPLPQNQDRWQAPIVEPFLTITTPQVFWFRVGQDWVTFAWGGGRNSGEYNPPLGRIIWEHAPPFDAIEAIDLVSGAPAEVIISHEAGRATVDDIALGGAPVAIRWRSGKR